MYSASVGHTSTHLPQAMHLNGTMSSGTTYMASVGQKPTHARQPDAVLASQADDPVLGAVERLRRADGDALAALVAKLDDRIFLRGPDRDPNGRPVPVNDFEKGLGAGLFAQPARRAQFGSNR